MSSQRLTSPARPILITLLLLVQAGCGSTGSAVKPAPGPDSQPAAGSPAVVESEKAGISGTAKTMFEQATSIMAAGDFIDAELRFKEFVLRYPDIPGAHVNLAIIHAENGDDAAVRAAVDAALALDPDHPAALNQLGMLHRRNGNFPEAEAAYLKAVTVSPDYALAHYNLGILNELYLQRLDTALQHFETYQLLVGEDDQVAKWIMDLKRRVAANQGTANVAE